jgi:hypothetical protein
MRIPLLGAEIDERFLTHRLRSTSIAGVAGGAVAILLFAYRYFIDHVWSSDLLAVALTVVAVKWAVLACYRLTD